MTNYSNSSMVAYTKISPNKNTTRVHPIHNPKGVIDKITIHHMAGNLTVEACGSVFQKGKASSNYGIGSDGRVAMYVEEKHRPWTSSSAANDYRAVTIEVANDGGASTNWHVSNKAFAALINLCVDICKRNNIKKINYTGDASGNLTRHNMFVATTCPGPYLQSKFEYIARQVNAVLESNVWKAPAPAQPAAPAPKIVKGSLVSLAVNAVYYSGRTVPAWVRNTKWYVDSVSGERVVLGKSADGRHNIISPVNIKYLTLVQASTSSTPAATTTFKAGDRVKLKANAPVYGSSAKFQSWVYKSALYIREISGTRAVISTKPSGEVTGAVHTKYLIKF